MQCLAGQMHFVDVFVVGFGLVLSSYLICNNCDGTNIGSFRFCFGNIDCAYGL